MRGRGGGGQGRGWRGGGERGRDGDAQSESDKCILAVLCGLPLVREGRGDYWGWGEGEGGRAQQEGRVKVGDGVVGNGGYSSAVSASERKRMRREQRVSDEEDLDIEEERKRMEARSTQEVPIDAGEEEDKDSFKNNKNKSNGIKEGDQEEGWWWMKRRRERGRMRIFTSNIRGIKSGEEAQGFWGTLGRWGCQVALISDTKGWVEKRGEGRGGRPADRELGIVGREMEGIIGEGCSLKGSGGKLDKNKQPVGGTAVGMMEGWGERETNVIYDERGWGRYTARVIQGRDGRAMVYISVYAPPRGSSNIKNNDTMWDTQLRGLQIEIEKGNRKLNKDPRLQLISDLDEVMRVWDKKGMAIVMAGDLNIRVRRSDCKGSVERDEWDEWAKLKDRCGMVDVARQAFDLVPDMHTWEQDGEDECRSKTWIDWMWVSKTVVDKKAVEGIWVCPRLNGGDHRGYIMDINIDSIIGVVNEEERGGGEKREREVRLLDSHSEKDLDTFLELMNDRGDGWEQRITDLEMKADEIGRWKEGQEGEGGVCACVSVLRAQMSADMQQLATLFKQVEGSMVQGGGKKHQKSHQGNKKGRRRRVKMGWSPEVARANKVLRISNKIIKLNYKERDKVISMWSKVVGDSDDECEEIMPPDVEGMPMSEVEKEGAWERWREGMRGEIYKLKQRLHGRERKKLRERIGENVINRDKRFRLGKQKHFLNSILKRGSGDGAVKRLVVGKGENERVISDPAEINNYMVGFYEEWMGRDRVRWFRAKVDDEDANVLIQLGWIKEDDYLVHPMYSEGAEGVRLRCKIDDGDIDDVCMPDRVRKVLEKCTRVRGKGGLPITPDDYTHNGVKIDDEISKGEWEWYWRRKGWKKMGGRSGVRNSHIKALVGKDGPWGEWIRRLVNISIRATVPFDQWLIEIYYSIPKVAGCMEVDKMRPLKFLEVLRKAVMGILNARMVSGMERMGLLHEMQSAFRVGRGCPIPLLLSNLLCEHKMRNKGELHMTYLDAKRAYDSVECTMGKEMPLRRMGPGEKYIKLMRLCEQDNKMIALTAGGYSDEVGGRVGKTDIGLGQGHEEAPNEWVLIGDIYVEVQKAQVSNPGPCNSVHCRGGAGGGVWKFVCR